MARAGLKAGLSEQEDKISEQATSNCEETGRSTAFSRLNAAYDALVSGLFAYNRKWRFHRDRETVFMRPLPWLPHDYERRMLGAMNGSSLDEDGCIEQANMLREISSEIVAKLQQEGLYGEDPVSEAFIRTHDEPGRAWNMQEWNRKRKARKQGRPDNLVFPARAWL